MAGVTTFLTMSYILAVNPDILSAASMDRGAVFTATALAAFFATLVMAIWAKLPFALAPGMGLNAFFAFTLVQGMGYSRQFSAFLCLPVYSRFQNRPEYPCFILQFFSSLIIKYQHLLSPSCHQNLAFPIFQ